MQWWQGAVTYQVYPRSFADSNGDGVGDLIGITQKLDYLAGLGVDAIWLSPFFKSPMKDMGYDVSDYTDVDPVFGTLADFDALIARAHELGLRVIIDQVLSHSSDQHPFFAQSRASRHGEKADFYVWADPKADGSAPNNWLSVFGGPAWTWDGRRQQYYLHNFLSTQPDFNFHNPQVQDWALSVMRFWLDRGVDGFRFDTVNYYFHDPKLRDNPADPRDKEHPEASPYGMQYHLFDKNQPQNLAWLARIRALLNDYGAISVGEVGDSHHALDLMGQYSRPDRLHQCYSFEMLGYDFSPAFMRSRIEGFFKAAPEGWPMWAFGNHDVPRQVSRWKAHGLDQDHLARQAGALLLSFEGSICLWQGEELGQSDTELALEELTDPQGIAFWPAPVGRDNTRTPMVWDQSPDGGFTSGKPWLPIKPAQLARHVAGQLGRQGSVLETYKEMIAFRKNSALSGRGTRFIDLGPDVLAFYRGEGRSSILAIFNLTPKPKEFYFDRHPLIKGQGPRLVGPQQNAKFPEKMLILGANGFVFLQDAENLWGESLPQ